MDLALEKKYLRVQSEVTSDDVPKLPFEKQDKVESGWFTTIVDNSVATKDKFDTEARPQMEQQLGKDARLNDAEIKQILDAQSRKFRVLDNGITKTHENPQAGFITIEDSRTEAFDLHRTYTEEVRVGKAKNMKKVSITREAIDPDDRIGHRKMVADNYRAAAENGKVKYPVAGLKEINRYNIVTPETQRVSIDRFPRDSRDANVEIEANPGDGFFEAIRDRTVHGAQIHKIFNEEPDFRGLQITRFTVHRQMKKVGVKYEATWYMKIHSEYQG